MSEVFLSKEDVAVLTGCKIRKAQVNELRRMGLHFYVNAQGAPVVPRASRPPAAGRRPC